MGFVPVPSESDVLVALRAFLLSILPSGIEVVAAQDNDVPEPVGSDFVTLNTVMRERISSNSTTYADCRFIGSVSGSTLTITSIQLGAVLPGSSLFGYLVAPDATIVLQLTGPLNGVGTYQVTPSGNVAQSVMQSGAELILQPIKMTVQIDIHGPNSGDNVQTISTLFRDDYAVLWFKRQGYDASGIMILDADQPKQLAFVNAEQNYENRWSLSVSLQANQVISPPQQFADVIDLTINPPADNQAS